MTTIQTKLAPRFWIRKLVLALIFLTLALVFQFAPIPFTYTFMAPLYAALSLLAALIFLLNWRLVARKKYTLHENGTLQTPTIEIAPPQMKSIQLLAWADRRIAKLEFQTAKTKNATTQSIKLDGWIHQSMDEIINQLNQRLNPQPSTPPDPINPDPPTDSGPPEPPTI